MTLSAKQKKVVGWSVGGTLVALGLVGVVLYLVLKQTSQPAPAPPTPTVTWTCVADDGQGYSTLLKNNVPCAKFKTSNACQAAAQSGTTDCSCPSGQVLYNSQCQPICFGGATWGTNNVCTCPSGTQWNGQANDCIKVCDPPVSINTKTGTMSGFFNYNGVCTNVTAVTTALPYLTSVCNNTVCDPSVCAQGAHFVGFDPKEHKCLLPNQCNGLPYYYSWPDGSNSCPGFNYNTAANGTSCVAPSTVETQVACEYNASGCGPGLQPLQLTSETCVNQAASSTACRPMVASPVCPQGAVVDPKCVGSKTGACYNSTTNTCVPGGFVCTTAAFPSTVTQPVGCRPDFENWSFDTTLGICLNKGSGVTTGLTVVVDTTTSTVDQLTLSLLFPSTYTVPLLAVQFRYLLYTPTKHWSGVVSSVQVTPDGRATVVLYPDQTVTPVPSGEALSLVITGYVQASSTGGSGSGGSWTPSITNGMPGVNIVSLPPSSVVPCLPTIGFSVNTALSYVSQLSVLPSTVAVTADAAALGVSNASSTPIQVTNGGSFFGVVVPVIKVPFGASMVDQVFVLLAWTGVSKATYKVLKNNTPLYSGANQVLVDTINVKTAAATTYQVQAVSTSDSSCVSLPIVTTCPPLELSGEVCTSMTTGTPSLINFLIPDPTQGSSACLSIPPSDEENAAFYACGYLQNPAKSLNQLLVPNSGWTECLAIQPVSQPVMIKDLHEDVVNGVPTGYCSDASCDTGYLNTQRSALCGCSGSPGQCANLTPSQLPFVGLCPQSNPNCDQPVGYMSADEFSTGFNGMAMFVKNNPKLLF